MEMLMLKLVVVKLELSLKTPQTFSVLAVVSWYNHCTTVTVLIGCKQLAYLLRLELKI